MSKSAETKRIKELAPYMIVAVIGLLLGALINDIFSDEPDKPGVVWIPFSEGAYQTALEQKKPMMIYFGADWCGPCQILHRETFTDPDVMADAGPFVRFEVDMSKPDEKAMKLQERFVVDGFPTILFIGKDGKERVHLRLMGFEEAARFRKRMAAALYEAKAAPVVQP